MEWMTVAQIATLMVVSGFVVNTVGADLIEKWKRK